MVKLKILSIGNKPLNYTGLTKQLVNHCNARKDLLSPQVKKALNASTSSDSALLHAVVDNGGTMVFGPEFLAQLRESTKEEQRDSENLQPIICKESGTGGFSRVIRNAKIWLRNKGTVSPFNP